MKRLQIAAALALALGVLAPAASAQLDEHVAFRQEMERLNREGTLRNPLLFLQLSCADGSPSADCQPIIWLLVRQVAVDHYRLPALPPNLVVAEARVRADKQLLKQEKGELTLFTQACQRLPVPDICDEQWTLKKVWTVGDLAADSVRLALRTTLIKPGVTSHQIGSETAMQTMTLEIPVAALAESLLIPVWEQNGILNIPATFSPRG